MNTNELWQAALGELELALSKPNFTTWFKNTFIAEVRDGEAILCVPNTFTKAWLEKKYHAAIIRTIQGVSSNAVRRVSYRVESRREHELADAAQTGEAGAPEKHTRTEATPRDAGTRSDQGNPTLNPKYLFSSFIVGKASELAHAAALAVAQKPGSAYNPLFIYGGVGLGKTHLLQAIGNELLGRTPQPRVLYVTSERFTNDFIHAVRSGRGKEFKDAYRNVDLLLVDDIQFLTGKEGTQEEFFHTFNALHQSNKQIVISSDRPPKAIPALEQRLLSRFEWGMTADISSPDLETRIAILSAKCRERSFDLPHDILAQLAGTIQSNVRELEGALNKIIAYHQFKNLTPSPETVKPLVANLAQGASRAIITPRQLITTVAQYYELPIDELLGKSREKRLAFPRQIIMYLMREELRVSYPAIGHEIGGRDHTTAMHAYGKISKELASSERLGQEIELIKQRLFTTV